MTPAMPLDVGYICGPPRSAQIILRTEAGPERWCFGERKRRTGRYILHGLDRAYVEEMLAYGWAEPWWSYECDGCGEDRRAGFGMVWEWDE